MESTKMREVLNFWFFELSPKDWFAKSEVADQKIEERFLQLHGKVAKGGALSWRETIKGRLAEVLVLDQFSRNLFRGTPQAFAFDLQALNLAREALPLAELKDLEAREKAFLYMPLMHSESLKVHEQAVLLFSQAGLEPYLEFELKHKRIIEKFGRYPHRNAILQRVSTPEEIEFLKQPGSSF